VTLPAFAAKRRCRLHGASAIYQGTALSSKPGSYRCRCRLTGQTDGRTDRARPLRRPCSVSWGRGAFASIFTTIIKDTLHRKHHGAVHILYNAKIVFFWTNHPTYVTLYNISLTRPPTLYNKLKRRLSRNVTKPEIAMQNGHNHCRGSGKNGR